MASINGDQSFLLSSHLFLCAKVVREVKVKSMSKNAPFIMVLLFVSVGLAIAGNGLALGAVADFGAQNCHC
jgi:hypothetical protein